MTSDLTLIASRRRELAEENERLAAAMAANDVELSELAMAEKVILRLTGASRDRPITTDAQPATRAVVRSSRHAAKAKPAKRTYGKRPLTEVLMEIVKESEARGIKRMEPKEALGLARERWKREAKPQDVSTAFWRLMKQGLLEKDDDTSFYRLPKAKPPTDIVPGQASVGGLSETQAEGREAAPGGGT